MKNFGPYLGEPKIVFSPQPKKSLGNLGKKRSRKNPYSKSNALVPLWLLSKSNKKKQYGTDKDAWEFIYGAHLQDQPLPDPFMHVHLFLEETSKDTGKITQFTVKRSVFPQSSNPMNPSQIKTDFEVIKDARRSDSPREEIEALLPLAACQFFMFHGENIRQMSQKHAEETHKAIELILEAETFRQGKEDMSFVAREIEKELDEERHRSGGMDDLLDLKKVTKEQMESIKIEMGQM